MLFATLDQLESDPGRAVITLATFVFALLVALTFHEFNHAAVATRLGDRTAQAMGRLTLHPRAHLDPLGTAMLFLAGFGWAKPVIVTPSNLRGNPRSGMAIVALAGPMSNLALAFVFAIPVKTGLVASDMVGFGPFDDPTDHLLGYVIGSMVFWNLLIASFNLIPMAPLDGFKVALGILPRGLASEFARLEQYGPMILFLIVMFDVIAPGPGILKSVIRPILNGLNTVILGGQLL